MASTPSYVRALLTLLKLQRTRTLATVTDAPLDRKVEMTNWEKVSQATRGVTNGSSPPTPRTLADGLGRVTTLITSQ